MTAVCSCLLVCVVLFLFLPRLYQHTWPVKSTLLLILPPYMCSLSPQGTPGAPGAPGNTGPSGKQGDLGPPVSLSVSESDTGDDTIEPPLLTNLFPTLPVYTCDEEDLVFMCFSSPFWEKLLHKCGHCKYPDRKVCQSGLTESVRRTERLTAGLTASCPVWRSTGLSDTQIWGRGQCVHVDTWGDLFVGGGEAPVRASSCRPKNIPLTKLIPHG